MKFLIFVLLMPLTLLGKNIAIIGDSISTGYQATNNYSYVKMLENRYRKEGKDVKIFNRSYPGAQTDTGDQIVVDLITKHKIDYLVINLGVNDAAHNRPQSELVDNFYKMAWKAQVMGAKVIIGGVFTNRINPSYQSVLEAAYNMLMSMNVYPYIFLTLDIVYNHSPDGIHPDDTGHALIADALYFQLQNLGV